MGTEGKSSETSLQELRKAVQTLKEALLFTEELKDNLTQYKVARDGAIQRFEYCIEQAWKVAMRELGSRTKFAKPAVREMARADLIDSAEAWLDFIEARNKTSHSYDEDVAREVFLQIQKFMPEVETLLSRLEKQS